MSKKKFYFEVEQDGKNYSIQTEIRLDFRKSAKHWETLETVHNAPEFAASASLYYKNKHEMGGQCLDTIFNMLGNSLPEKFITILGLWKRNHLNDMNAGTKVQTEFLEMLKSESPEFSKMSLYDISLKFEGCPEKGYKYGHGWLYRSISPEDLKTINDLINDKE